MSSINSIDSVHGITTEVKTNENDEEVTLKLQSQDFDSSSSDSGTTASSTKKVKGKYEKKNNSLSKSESDSDPESEGKVRVPKEGEIIPQFVCFSQLHLCTPQQLPRLSDEAKQELMRRRRVFDHTLFNSPRRNPIRLAKELKLSSFDQQEIALACSRIFGWDHKGG